MTIQDRNAAIVYQATKDKEYPAPPRVAWSAEVADDAFNALAKLCKEKGLRCPADDRAENIVHAIFRMLVDENDMQTDDLSEVVAKLGL